MALHMELGHPTTGDVVFLDGNRVRFVTEGGRTMFEVHIGTDGRSIEVRGVEATKVAGNLYSGLLDVRPNVANSITVLARRCDEES